MLATHSTDEATELCDRIGVLDRGRLLAVGTPAEFGADLTRDEYRAWLRGPVAPALDRLLSSGTLARGDELSGRDGEWREFSLVVPGGHDSSAHVIRALVEHVVDVARVERVPISAADIIERVLGHSRGPATDV